MAFATNVIVENFMNRLETLPIELAPAALRTATDKANEAISAHYDADSNLEDAVDAIPRAESIWNQDAEQAVKDGKPLPPKEEIERAIISQTIAEKELRRTTKAKDVAFHAVAQILGKESVRDEWRANIEKALTPVQQGLKDTAVDIAREVYKVGVFIGTTRFLGEFGEHYFIPGLEIDDPSKFIQALAIQKPFIPGVPFEQVNRFQQEGVVDDRPPVFIVNSGGGIHNMVAAKAEEELKQVGWRLATTEEISSWYKRQGLKQPA